MGDGDGDWLQQRRLPRGVDGDSGAGRWRGGAAPLLRALWAPLSAPDTDRTGHNGGTHGLATPHAPPTARRLLAQAGRPSSFPNDYWAAGARGALRGCPVGLRGLLVKCLMKPLDAFLSFCPASFHPPPPVSLPRSQKGLIFLTPRLDVPGSLFPARRSHF